MDKFPLIKNEAEKTMSNGLKEVYRLQEAIIDASALSIISTDTKGIIQGLNKAAENLLGYAADELIGKSTLVTLHDNLELIERASRLSEELGLDVDPNFEALSFKAQFLKSPDRENWTYIRKNGSRVYVSVSMNGLWDDSDKLLGYTCVVTDISETKRAQQLVKKSEAHLNALVSSLDDIVFEIDDDGRFLNVWTKNDDDLFFPRAKILGRTFNELFDSEFAQSLEERRRKVL